MNDGVNGGVERVRGAMVVASRELGMAKFSIREIYDAARAAGFTPEQATTWTAIALAESGGRTSALNNKGEHSMGLWQINVASNVRKNRWGDLNDPLVNARAAYDVSRHGRDMRPWTTTHDRNKGTAHDYRTYLAKVEQVTGVDGETRGVTGTARGCHHHFPRGRRRQREQEERRGRC